MKLILRHIPPKWRAPFFITSGSIVGLVFFLMYISNFFSYLSDDPKTCMNCHIMGPEYATWYHSAHRENATCNDCHVPQDNIFKTYFFKAKDGMRHSFMFTLKLEPQAIIIKEEGKIAVQNNCKRCHENVLREFKTMESNGLNSHDGLGRNCWDCHKETPHGKVRSLSATPFAKVPTTESMVPDWLTKLMNKEQNKSGSN